jgi:hypothetical protein
MLQDEDNDWAWDDMRDNLQYALMKVFPSLDKFNGWHGNECQGLLKNDHVKFYTSEYCGCGAISVVVDNDEYPELAEAWLAQVWDRMTDIIGGYVDTLRLIATGSNGIPFYERV